MRRLYVALILFLLSVPLLNHGVYAVTLTPSPTTATPGDLVTVTLAAGSGSASDYIGLFAAGAADGAYLQWQYLNGLHAPPGTGLTAATLKFTMTVGLGTYEFRLCNSGCTLTSASITILNASAPAGAIPANYFGMHVQVQSVVPTVPVGSLAKGSRNDWSNIESARGVLDWTNMDSWMSYAEAHGWDFFFSFYGTPLWAAASSTGCVPAISGWYCPSLPADMTDLDNFVTALVTRYAGRLKYYELDNEPGVLGITPADLVTWSNRIIPIIRALDPTALIISPSMANYQVTYDDLYYSLGGPTTVDALSFHGYPFTPVEPEGIDVSYQGGGQTQVWGPVKTVINKYPALAGKPVFDTEAGWGTNAYFGGTADQQAAYVARAYLLRWANSITRYYWYGWDNELYGTMMNVGGSPNSAGIAFGQVYAWMVGATMSTRCVAASGGPVWTCAFTRPGGYQALAVWNTSGSSSYTPSSTYTQYRTVDNATVTSYTPGTARTIGIKPLLLENFTATGGPGPSIVLRIIP